jgi:hypothetical protein
LKISPVHPTALLLQEQKLSANRIACLEPGNTLNKTMYHPSPESHRMKRSEIPGQKKAGASQEI